MLPKSGIHPAIKYVLLALLVAAPLWLPASVTGRVAVIMDVDGSIGPATSDYLSRGIASAREQDAALIILRMNTPGGLDSAMRDIIQEILVSSVPVACFVAPSGARAASAGTYILYASHIAAMSPGTNLGAATPVAIGGIPDPDDLKDKDPLRKKENGDEAGEDKTEDASKRKTVNDAAAYLRSLAHMRGRNEEWAELAVREAASLPAAEALEMDVIDLIARDITDLLAQLDGRTVEVLGKPVTLDTGVLQLQTIEPDWRSRLLAVITDPNVAYILMLIGIYGLFFEFANPGYVLPGVAGAISLILALYAFQILPVNYAGLALLVLGIIFMLGEAIVPSFGALGIGGVIAFVIGSIILFDEGGGQFGVSLPLILTVALVSAGFFIFVVGAAIEARRRPVVSGQEEMLNAVGEVIEDFEGEGRIHIHGEVWAAKSPSPVHRGDKVRVVALDGLVLHVQPLSEEY